MTSYFPAPIVTTAQPHHNTDELPTPNAHWLDEFAASAIGPEMARLNADWVEGDEVVEESLGYAILAELEVL